MRNNRRKLIFKTSSEYCNLTNMKKKNFLMSIFCTVVSRLNRNATCLFQYQKKRKR